jgi:hypothetical protein
LKEKNILGKAGRLFSYLWGVYAAARLLSLQSAAQTGKRERDETCNGSTFLSSLTAEPTFTPEWKYYNIRHGLNVIKLIYNILFTFYTKFVMYFF